MASGHSRWIAGCGAVVGIVILVPLLALSVVGGMVLCGERAGAPVLSPDGRYAARVVEGNCGATTPLVVDVYLTDLRARPTVLYGRTGRVLSLHGSRSDVTLVWPGATELRIALDRCDGIYQQESAWGAIRVSYATQCAAPSRLAD